MKRKEEKVERAKRWQRGNGLEETDGAKYKGNHSESNSDINILGGIIRFRYMRERERATK